MTGKSLGADVSVYEDATLGPGDVLGVEALAMTERAQPPGIGIARAHTATTAASCMLLVLSTPLLAIGAIGARISQQLVDYGTRRRAQLTVIHQALCRAPVFSAIDLRRLMRVAPLFEVRSRWQSPTPELQLNLPLISTQSPRYDNATCTKPITAGTPLGPPGWGGSYAGSKPRCVASHDLRSFAQARSRRDGFDLRDDIASDPLLIPLIPSDPF